MKVSPATILVLAFIIACAVDCYPKECDPAKDPLRCQCPPGPCDDYPKARRDAGPDGAR